LARPRGDGAADPRRKAGGKTGLSAQTEKEIISFSFFFSNTSNTFSNDF
jgi:hypothetical protein